MTDENATVEFEFPEELLDKAEECADERGFRDLEHFVKKAVRDAVNAEDPYTEEARERIEEAREAYDEGKGVPLEDVIDELDLE